MDYDHTKDPEPKYFEEILRNSLSEDDIKRFCTDFLALFRPKPHKQPVACAIGPADSGKTSLFSPVFQIVPLNRIARVTKQKNFNKAMIDRYTEVIFLDEAFAGLLDVDDWKIICQGGFTSHDAKWKNAEGFLCTATMFVTCQADMDFGADHNEAMDRRLNRYFFKSLPSVVPEANNWLREHAMDCIAWAQKIAGNSQQNAVTTPSAQEGGLPQEELENILGVSLDEEDVEGSTQPGCSRENEFQSGESSHESDTSETSGLETLRREEETTDKEGLRGRQLAIMLQSKERVNRVRKRTSEAIRNRRLADRRSFLVELGVVGPLEANEQVTDPDSPLPTPLEERKERAIQERKKQRELQERLDEQEKIKRAYENPWLVNLEKEMADHSKRMEETENDEERAVMKSLLEVNSDKLRLYHERKGTLRLPSAVEKRKSFCLENELVEKSCVNLIRDVFSPLPVILGPVSQSCGTPLRTGQESSDDQDDDDSLFITPKTPSYVPQYNVEFLCPPSPLMVHSPRKRPRVQSHALPKKQQLLTRSFQSQQ